MQQFGNNRTLMYVKQLKRQHSVRFFEWNESA